MSKYNDIHTSTSCLVHDSINAVENISHQLINIVTEKYIPVVNDVLHTNLDTNVYTYPNYQTKTQGDKILIYIEIPGLKKEDCHIIHKRGSLEFKGTSRYQEAFNFLKPKKYRRSFKVPATIEKENVNAIYENGVIYLTINIPTI